MHYDVSMVAEGNVIHLLHGGRMYSIHIDGECVGKLVLV